MSTFNHLLNTKGELDCWECDKDQIYSCASELVVRKAATESKASGVGATGRVHKFSACLEDGLCHTLGKRPLLELWLPARSSGNYNSVDESFPSVFTTRRRLYKSALLNMFS